MWFGSRRCGAEVWRVGDKALALVERTRGCVHEPRCAMRADSCAMHAVTCWTASGKMGGFSDLRVRLHYWRVGPGGALAATMCFMTLV